MSLFEKYDHYYFLKQLMKNFDASGKYHTIIASPSKNDPDYYYEWVRDSGIIINYIIDLLNNNVIPYEFFDKLLINYVNNHLHFQSICIHENHLIDEIDINLGEPKFNIDGSPFVGSWGRPQNDGPALRSLGMIKLANYLMKNFEKSENYIKKKLYDCKYPITHTIIKRDLEYICNVYNNPCFDLWEEIYGKHFYTLMVQKKALELGSELAIKLGDYGAGEYYLHISKLIGKKLKDFYKDGKIISSIDITNQNYKTRKYDISILLAFLHTNTNFNNELIETVIDMIEGFKEEYEINKNSDVILVGRYFGDEYYGGNPWVLTSASLSKFFKIVKKNNFKNDRLNNFSYDYNEKILEKLFQIEELNKNKNINVNKKNMNFAEQIMKNSFEYISADRLTWNYIEIMRALD